jgi:fucose 4-O-acetylase-like acetyltransferase
MPPAERTESRHTRPPSSSTKSKGDPQVRVVHEPQGPAGVLTERDIAIDALKGLAIASVVLGHCIYGVAWVHHPGPGLVAIAAEDWVPLAVATNPLLSLVYSFHMPLFAFASGFVLWRAVPRPPLEQLKRRAVGLMIPYFSWAAIYHLFAVWRGETHPSPAAAVASAITGVSTTGILWYLYALFICSVLLIGFERLPRPRLALSLAAIAAIAICQLPFLRTSVLATSQVLWIFPFFAFGYVVAPEREAFRRWRTPIALVCGVAFLVLAYLQYPVQVPQMSHMYAVDTFLDSVGVPGSLTIVRYLTALSAIAALLALYSAPSRLLGPQAWLGRRTLGVFGSSAMIEALLVMAGVRSWLVLFVTALSLAIVATLVLERTPGLRFLLLGKKVAH